MSKITFRADEELVERIEARDDSKSEVMREALRQYLDDSDRDASADRGRSTTDERPAPEASTARREPAARDSPAHRERPAPEASAGRHDGRSTAGRGERRPADSLDDFLAERVDELVAERLAAWEARERRRVGERRQVGDRGSADGRPQDVNVNVTLETDRSAEATDAEAADAEASRVRASDAASDSLTTDSSPDAERDDPPVETETTCGQCGESLSDDHVYCPNCGEKAARRLFCECGDEVRSDWGFCPSCGRRTPAADVLDQT